MGKEQAGAAGSDNNNALFYLLFVVLVLGIMSKVLRPFFNVGREFWRGHHLQFILCFWFSIIVALLLVLAHCWNNLIEWQSKKEITTQDSSTVYLGVDLQTQEQVHLKEAFRTSHTQVIGSTNAGKTASVIMPWAVQDIEYGRGLLIIDGKADQGFLNKIYAHAVKNNRQNDFKVFSLANPAISSTYNPFCQGTPEQIAERVFSTLEVTEPFYAGVQFAALRTTLALLMRRGEKPMPGVVRELLRNREVFQGWAVGLEDRNLAKDVCALLEQDEDTFHKNYAGLVTAIGHFSQGATAPLYNTRHPEIDLLEVIKRKQICYFQLPTMQFPFLGAATGKLVLQSLQSAVSEIQVGSKRPESLFSVYLDDFNDYIYPAFSSLLNKSRSANVGVVFSHQSLGDLEKVGPDFKQIVITNTNIKVIMRSNDPESAEHFAKIIGTKKTEKTTERRVRSLFGQKETGDQSVREVEEYRFHPNTFKSELGTGEGVVVIPHPSGAESRLVRFAMVPDLPVISLPIRDLTTPDLLREATSLNSNSPEPKTISKRGSSSKPNSSPKVSDKKSSGEKANDK